MFKLVFMLGAHIKLKHMNNWRLIKNLELRGAKQMAIDESMLIARSKNLAPNTLRFFTWKPSAITVGFFQDLKQEINEKKAEELGVEIVRRYTGGGAVFHEDELTYSLVIKEKDLPSSIEESYKHLCHGVVLGLEKLGLKASFKPINDILVNDKKISGNGQTRKYGVILQHGTILLSVDVEKMFSILKVSNEKLKGKLIKNVKERVTSLKNELPQRFTDINYLQEIFAQGFSKALNANFKTSDLIKEEKEMIDELYLNKYLTKDWNYKQKYEKN